jgi:type IV pilus assembly protein PilO
MEKLIEQFLKIPLGTRLAGLVGFIVLMFVGNYFLILSDLYQQEAANKATYARLQKDLIDKQIIANNLNDYRRRKEQLEQKLAEALTELPNTKEIDELIRQLDDVGKKAGLDITNIEPGPEAQEGFYAKIPIKMSVAGNYHEIAQFFESVSRLRRIVNIRDISFSSPEMKNEKVTLKADYLATTFRFIPPAEQRAPGAKP